ncbi:transcriptional regulator [Aliivibrio sp. S4TY2]|uniref:transcriptional regulator n=1 Tax=unclassified Aliivibrio TaxID=2645654 RepID=UPI00237885A2|nr:MULTISPECIES: transcriptional regulator [unclassified Aliivibrio]MDD9158209.1 transcriptional regulator [Aliivibrio sp. S4TY2]MDD9162124.1 transcriptional regulator [Aliivibrio sp. S4TY1]MDD9166162.1 transcriptional regulator [Aliivibrio sp. S4MY2]MDD9170160.1 transcriptional regulator [Aliivibrio sp. S4MY4]MDD9187195.1 transcriptional regulator [Aliivibrio sp. S4MY3]
MNRLFEQILKKYRIRSGITQEFMVDLLSNNSPKLHKLDNVTFSRWERGITIPPFRKQIEVYQLLEVDPIDELIELGIELPVIDSNEYFVTDQYMGSIDEFSLYLLDRNNISDIDLFLSDIQIIVTNDLYLKRLIEAFQITEMKAFISMLIECFNTQIYLCKYGTRLIAHSITLYVTSDFMVDVMGDNIDILNMKSYSGSHPFAISFHSSTLPTLEFILGNILNEFMSIPTLDVKLYLSSIEKNTHKLFTKLKAKVKYNEPYNRENQKTSELSKIDVSISKEAMYLITTFRRKYHEE